MTKLNPCPDCGREPEIMCRLNIVSIKCQSCVGALEIKGAWVGGAMNAWNAATNGEQAASTEKTLRDEFAMRSPFTAEGAAEVLHAKGIETTVDNVSEWLAAVSYVYADRMLKERSK